MRRIGCGYGTLGNREKFLVELIALWVNIWLDRILFAGHGYVGYNAGKGLRRLVDIVE